MTKTRSYLKERLQKSQGRENKSVCATAVASYFGAANEVRYLHTIQDIIGAVRKAGYTVRSRKSSVKKDISVGGLRLLAQQGKLEFGKYIIRVDGHALVMNQEGTTVVDTDPRKRDRRKITHLYKVGF